MTVGAPPSPLTPESPERPRDHRLLVSPRRTAAITCALACLTALLFAVVANHDTLSSVQALDDAFHRTMVSIRDPVLTDVAKVLNVVGLVYVTLPVRLVIAAYLAFRRRWWLLAAFAGAVIVSEVGVGLLKNSYGRPRPTGSLVATTGASFPSGHSLAISVTALAAVMVLVPEGLSRRRWGAAALALVGLMALSRAYLGAHWLSDAVAGVLLGATLALGAALTVDWLRRRQSGG